MTPQKHKQAKNETRVCPAFDQLGGGALFVPGLRPMDRRPFVLVNPVHARYVRTRQLGTQKKAHGSLGRSVVAVVGVGKCRLKSPKYINAIVFLNLWFPGHALHEKGL